MATIEKQYEVMANQNSEISEMIAELAKQIESLRQHMAQQPEANVAIIRDIITKTYYKYNRIRRIPSHEIENIHKLYAVYKTYSKNTFVADLITEMRTWQIVYPATDVGGETNG